MQTKSQRKTEHWTTEIREAWLVLGGFLTALLLSRVQIHGMHIPLAAGLLLGSALAGIESYGTLGGVILGGSIVSPPDWQTMCTAILFIAAERFAQWRKKTCGTRMQILLFAAASVASLPLAAVYGVKELLYGAGSVVLSVLFGVSAFFAIRACRSVSSDKLFTEREQAAFVLTTAAILTSLSEVQLFGWSASVSFLLALCAWLVTVRGVYGAAAGTLWAALLVLYTGADPSLIGAVALGALLGASVRRFKKPAVALSFAAASALFGSILSEHALAVNLQNLLPALLFYVLIPRDWSERLTQMTDASVKSARSACQTIERIEQGASDELMRMGTVLSGFSGMFHTVLQEEDAVKRWTVQGALTVCRSCEKQKHCWKDGEAMQEAILTLAERADRNQTAAPIDPIDPMCKRFDDLTASALLSYQQAINRNTVCSRVKEQSALIDRQFTGAGKALCEYAERMRERGRDADLMRERIRSALTEIGLRVVSVDRYTTQGTEVLSLCVERPLRIRNAQIRETVENACGFRLRMVQRTAEPHAASFVFERDANLHASVRVFRSGGHDTLSGDATGECRLIGGHVCFALSDGMGSGEAARKESDAAIGLLFRLYQAGMQRELIYDNVNRLLLVRNETEMYATLDAVSIDLNSGESELLKYGAPPSFLVRNGRVKPIFGEALPCGILAEAKPSVIRLKLQPNDRLVLCSDGVQDVLKEGPEQVIRSAAKAQTGIGEQILKTAQSRGGADDMTVMVIRVA